MAIPKHTGDESNEVEFVALQFKDGSVEAFQWLYNKFSKKIYRYCLRMVGDEMSAKDAYQEAFLRVFEHKSTYRGENFSAWIYTIARRTCLNIIRSRKHHIEYNELNHSIQVEPEIDVFLQHHLTHAINALPLPFREALLLREFEGLSYQEISEVLGIELSLAKVRVHRARLLIRRALAPIIQE